MKKEIYKIMCDGFDFGQSDEFEDCGDGFFNEAANQSASIPNRDDEISESASPLQFVD